MRSAVHFLGGSLAVYLLMAACSAGSKGSNAKAGPESEPVVSQGGNISHGGGTTAANAGTSNASGGDTVATGGKPADGNAGSGNASGGSLGGMIGDIMDPVDNADAAPAASGTRLRARYYVGEDGSKQFIGWHDKVRNEDCYIQKSEDGQLRCMPLAGAAAAAYFGDATCSTQPLTIAAKATPACANAPAPVPATMYLAEACGANRMLYTVGQTPVGAVYTKSGTNCVALPQTLLDTYNFYPLTAPVAAPASSFVAAIEQVE